MRKPRGIRSAGDTKAGLHLGGVGNERVPSELPGTKAGPHLVHQRQGGTASTGQILIAIAAAVITVVGVVFSVVMVALTLASAQFGPLMLRNFIRDRGTQVTLGTFVASFVYAVLALAGHSARAARALSRISASP